MSVVEQRSARLRLLRDSDRTGLVEYANWRLPCAIGRAGVRALKREGDGATPPGLWALREVLYRPDRTERPRTALPVRALRPNDGWCDAVGDRSYNRLVRLPYPASAETLWRDDDLYDIVVLLGFNDSPRVQGRGSAIFMHIARADFNPTAGCVALRREHVLRLVEAPAPPLWIDTRSAG